MFTLKQFKNIIFYIFFMFSLTAVFFPIQIKAYTMEDFMAEFEKDYFSRFEEIEKWSEETNNFSGAKITSDAGFLLVREIDQRVDVIQSGCEILKDTRSGSHTKHSFEQMIRQTGIHGLQWPFRQELLSPAFLFHQRWRRPGVQTKAWQGPFSFRHV